MTVRLSVTLRHRPSPECDRGNRVCLPTTTVVQQETKIGSRVVVSEFGRRSPQAARRWIFLAAICHYAGVIDGHAIRGPKKLSNLCIRSCSIRAARHPSHDQYYSECPDAHELFGRLTPKLSCGRHPDRE